MFKFFLSFSLFFLSFELFASLLTPLPLSYGALLYDVNFPAGPGSHGTNSSGQWVDSLNSFNAGALAQNKITRLYPYSSDIEITCSDPNNVSTCTILPGYTTGQASVLAYHNAFSSAQIIPIVDIAFTIGNNKLLKTNTTLADNVAQALVTAVCNDPNADGIFFDIETSGSLNDPGLFELYRQVSKLFAGSACVDGAHPNGRYMGVYLTPVLTPVNDWATAQAMLAGQNNGFLAIPLYDTKGFTSPPTPDLLSGYSQYVTSALGHANTYATQYKVAYSIIVPAAASFGTFQEYGIYNAAEPAPTYFQLLKDYSTSNATQLAFVQNAQKVSCLNQNPYFMGMDYWAWNQYVNPGQNGDGTFQLVMPNVPDAQTVSYLQASASCH
jgi:hypothetical protein